jgi:hypothetical protein
MAFGAPVFLLFAVLARARPTADQQVSAPHQGERQLLGTLRDTFVVVKDPADADRQVPMTRFLPPSSAETCPLSANDIVFVSEYPYRTIRRTEKILYQLVCLGYNSVGRFQESHGLGIDDLIGPRTAAAVDREFQARFSPTPAADHRLRLDLEIVGPKEHPVGVVRLSNLGTASVTVKGSIGASAQAIQRAEPSIFLGGGWSHATEGRIADGFWGCSVRLDDKDRTLEPNATVEKRVALGSWPSKTSGTVSAAVTYIDSSGKVTSVETDGFLRIGAGGNLTKPGSPSEMISASGDVDLDRCAGEAAVPF